MTAWQVEVTACPTCDGWREIDAVHCVECRERLRRPPILIKRPVAFRVPRADLSMAGEMYGTEWCLFQDEDAASEAADDLGCNYQALFVRDGMAIVAEWETMESAPKDGSSFLGVWWSSISVGELPKPHVGICSWAGAWTPYDRKLTHWMPLPLPPRVLAPVGTQRGGS